MSQVSAALWRRHAVVLTTGLENSISWASCCPLTPAASWKSSRSSGALWFWLGTLFTITSKHNEFRKWRRDTHQYTKMHLPFLAPCSPPHSPIHTELNIQAIYPWHCNFSLLPWGLAEKRKWCWESRSLTGQSLKLSSRWAHPFIQTSKRERAHGITGSVCTETRHLRRDVLDEAFGMRQMRRYLAPASY